MFVGGFFAGGTFMPGHVSAGRAKLVEAAMRDPAWRLVRLVAHALLGRHGFDVIDLVDRPELVSLRAVYEVSLENATRLATGPERPLTELGVGFADGEDHGAALATCSSLPALTTLGLHLSTDPHTWLAEAPVMRRIRRLVVGLDFGYALSAFTAFVDTCVRRPEPLREILVRTGAGPLFGASSWTLRLMRDRAPGPFTRVVGRYESPKESRVRSAAYHLRALSAVSPATLASLELDTCRSTVKLSAAEREVLDETLAPFAQLPFQRPWATP